jgi:type IV pilus assembly protein PilP
VKNKMKKFKFIILNIFIIIHTVFIFAYAAEIKDTPVSVPPSSAAPAAVQPQIQQQVQTEKTPDSDYKYYPLGKPDPFQPFVEVDIATKKKEEKKVSTYPLERDEIEKFKLAGIIGDHIQRLAIIEIMEEGKLRFYPLLRGTHIGLHNGRVLEVMADRVIIEEYDKSKTRRFILKLHKENEVKP